MKKTCKLLGLSLALAAGAAAHAQSKPGPFYGELSYAAVKVEDSGYSFTPKVLRGIVGYEFHPNFAVEGMLGLGITDDSLSIAGIDVTGEVKNVYGLYLRPKVALSPEVELFGRAGFARSKVGASALGRSASDSGSDISYGLGLAYKVSASTAITGDYMSYYNKDGVKANGWSLGVRVGF